MSLAQPFSLPYLLSDFSLLYRQGKFGNAFLQQTFTLIGRGLKVNNVHVLSFRSTNGSQYEIAGLAAPYTGKLTIEPAYPLSYDFLKTLDKWKSSFQSGLPYFITNSEESDPLYANHFHGSKYMISIPLYEIGQIWGCLILGVTEVSSFTKSDGFLVLVENAGIITPLIKPHFEQTLHAHRVNSVHHLNGITHSSTPPQFRNVDDVYPSKMNAASTSSDMTDVYSLFFEKIPSGIWIRYRDNSGFVYLNRAIATILNIPYQDIVRDPGFNFTHYIHPDDRSRVAKLLLHHQKNRVPFTTTWRFVKPDGAIRWAQVNAFSINEHLVGGIITDITDSREREEELSLVVSKMDELNKLKSQIIQNVGEYFRTPLCGIIGYTDLLEDQLSDKNQLQMIAGIKDSSYLLQHTLESILEYSIISSKSLTPHNSLQYAEELFTLCLVEAKTKAEQKGIYFQTHFEGQPVFYTDKRMIGSIVSRIVDNSINATRSGGIRIGVHIDSHTLTIQVSDTGYGIPERFKHANSQLLLHLGEKRTGAHTPGMGLAIVRKYIETLQGKLTFMVNEFAGTTALIEIPITVPEVSNHPKEDLYRSKGRILYVEDNHLVQIMAGRLFHNYELDKAFNTEEALNHLETTRYDLIFIDISLGDGLNGAELCRIIRKNPRQEGAYIVAATANAAFKDPEILARYGFNSAIIKPLNIQMMREYTRYLNYPNAKPA